MGVNAQGGVNLKGRIAWAIFGVNLLAMAPILVLIASSSALIAKRAAS
jgi:hypothetical protein